MRGEGDIPTIFNPHRVRAPPNLVVTTENSSPGSVPNGPFTRQNSTQPQLQHTDSVSGSQQEGTDSSPQHTQANVGRFKKCANACCSKSAKKIYCGICVTICVTASWVGTTHSIKYMYLPTVKIPVSNNVTNTSEYTTTNLQTYDAPFFTTWFITNWLVLFFPIYFICQGVASRCKSSADIFSESIQNFREKGFSFGRFMGRCSLFCILWVFTNYVYIRSLRILFATDVVALFATNVAFVYLLSWVILHKQFVGVRIVAVIMCDTGTALLAYMDGINTSPTLTGVVLAAASAFGSAVYKVLFKRVFGDVTFGQIGLFFSLIGIFNAIFFWPISLALYFAGVEILVWEHMPWIPLLIASSLSLVANLLGNFSVAWTYDLFITLGLVTAVPVSAALDIVLYGANFVDMELAGIILISIGFFLVMFPDNWPNYITRLLRLEKVINFFIDLNRLDMEPNVGRNHLDLLNMDLAITGNGLYGLGEVIWNHPVDNAPAHPSGLEADLLEEFKVNKIQFLPPNTSPLLQPMDINFNGKGAPSPYGTCMSSRLFFLRWSRRNQGLQSNQGRAAIDYRTGYIRSHLRSPSGRVR